MGQYTRTTRFFAVMLVGGGIAGIAIAAIVGITLIQQNGLFIIPMAALAVLFAWATFIGVRLWQGMPYGRKWAPVLFASQIPVLALPGFKYQWFTGAELGVAMQFGGGSSRLGFSANLGANGQFFLGTDVTEFAVGVNLFAVVALVLLVRSTSRSRRTASRLREPSVGWSAGAWEFDDGRIRPFRWPGAVAEGSHGTPIIIDDGA